MSNYPPPPHVGSYNPFQHPYQQQNQASHFYGQSQSNGVSPAPHANSYSFQANAQDGRATVPDNGVNHGPTFPGYSGQIPYNTLPPPPYPPVPIPYGAPSYAPQYTTQPAPNVNTASAYQSPLLYVSHPQHSPIVDPPTTKPLSPTFPELEDGEVDDIEPDETVKRPEAPIMGSFFSRSSKGEQNESEGSRIVPIHSNEMNQIPRLTQYSQSEPNGHASISSPQPQRPPIQNGILDYSCDSPSSQLMHDLSRSHTSERNPNPRPEQATVLMESKAHEARQALHDLFSKDYEFNHIVEKGLNPTILKGLYMDIGIPVTSPPPPQQQQYQVMDPSAEDTPMTGTSDAMNAQNGNSGQPHQLKNASYTMKPSRNDKSSLSKVNSHIQNPPTVITAKDEKSQPTVAKPAKGVPGKGLGLKAGESKAVDRKEYIARMLAAKAGKPASSASTPAVLMATTSTKTSSVVQTKTPPAPSNSIPVTNPQVVQITTGPNTSSSPQPRKEDVEAEAKRKSQTDLARQKIEALKIRESQQQETRTAASNEEKHQKQQPLLVPQIQGPFDRPMTAPQSTVPSRQGSYFSPTSQKPPFSIPGLFMTSDALQSAKPPQQMGRPNPETSQLKDSQVVFPPVQLQSYSSALQFPNLLSITADPPSLPSYTVDTTAATLPSIHETPTVNHRKRQKAADFIDSPSLRVKKPLGEQEHSSVIIDISEDDASSLADEILDVELEYERNGLALQPRSKGTGIETQKSFRDVPPLSEIPNRKKAAVTTPPATQTPAQTKDTKGLKTKEMEIEQMNRRIKELEQRITAKKTISRAQTPGASGSAMVSSPASQSSQKVIEQSGVSTDVANPAHQLVSPAPARYSSLPAVGTTESAKEEELAAEQQLQEVELAKAEVESELAADAIRASQENRQALEDISKGPDQDRQQWLEEDNQGNQKEAAIETRETDKSQRRQQQVLDEGQQRRLQEERRRLRKTEIESGLPVIDATVERTRQRLQNLRKEIEDLEEEVQRGVEDKKVLLEELYRLSQTTATPETPLDSSPPAMNGPRSEVAMTGGITPDLLKASAPREEISDSAPQQNSEATDTIPKDAETLQAPQASSFPAQIYKATFADGELEEDVMDISRSDIDEGEVTESYQESAAEALDDSHVFNDEESYQPPSDIGANQQLLDNTKRIGGPEKGDIVMQDDAPMGNRTTDRIAGMPHSNTEVPTNAAVQHKEQSAHLRPFLADASDDDDYEPPEPSSYAEETAVPIPVLAHDAEASFSPLATDSDNEVAPAQSILQAGLPSESKDEMFAASALEACQEAYLRVSHLLTLRQGTARESLPQIGQFSPYESPLKQFKAFRYHPKYLTEVSTGFRSLTYSHAINPDTPVCRYELGGVCNDDSCESQHIKSMSDEKILVDLGAAPDGLSQGEAEAFTNSLRELIQNIRSRKIKDVNVVAREITAHRAKFLGDPSKVLSL